jgi:hypothetical protein
MPNWADLNERQQKYLQEIYNQDKENERYERGIANCLVSDFCKDLRATSAGVPSYSSVRLTAGTPRS